MPKIQKPSCMSISTISASSGASAQTMCAAMRPRLASSALLAALSGGNRLVKAGSQTPPDVSQLCSGQSRIAPPRKPPAQVIASIMRSGLGIGRGSAMPMRSIVRLVGVSYQPSNASRMNSLRLPGVVGSQLRARCSPPMNSSKRPSASVSSCEPRMLHSGTSPNGSCSERKPFAMVWGRGPCTVRLNQRAVPRRPVMR